MLVWSRARVRAATAGVVTAVLAGFSTFFALLPVSGGYRPRTKPGPGSVALAPALCEIPLPICVGGAAYCSELVLFAPATGAGYEDFPDGGETWDDQWASYIRRDLMMRVQYAAAKVACISSSWPDDGNGGPIALGDMSEWDGSIPGTSFGAPGHPRGSHIHGNDIDIAYYQRNTPDNRLRPVCPDQLGDQSAHRCVGAPDLLDARRTALFIGFLFEHPGIRIVGVDGRIGPVLEAELGRLEQDGLLSTETVDAVRLAYETRDDGRGWFYYHHHHMHVSAVRR